MNLAPWQKPVRGMQVNKSHPLARGLVGCWVFNEATGDMVFDLSGNGNHGDNNGASWVADGLKFDGSNDNVNCGNSPSLNFDGADKFSIGFWFKATSPSTRQFIVSKYGGGGAPGYYIDYYPTSDAFRLLIYDDVDTTPLVLEGGDNSYIDKEWHNLVVVFDGASSSNSAMYFDGILKSSGQINQTGDFTNTQPLYMGDYVVSSLPFKGTISFLCIYNRALSAEDIAQFNRKPYAMFEQPISPAVLYSESVGGLSIPVAMHHLRQQGIA